MNLAAQPPKASPHVLRPRVGVRPPRLHQPKLGQLSQTTQSTSPCLPLACLFTISLRRSPILCRTMDSIKHWDRAGGTQGKGWVTEESGRTWQCRRNACPSGDHSFSSWSAAPLTPQTYKINQVRVRCPWPLTSGTTIRCLAFLWQLTFLAWPKSPAGLLSQPRTACLWRPYCKNKQKTS